MFDFHRFLFEHKTAEALRLVRALGATEISVEHVQGWDERIGIDLGAALPETVQIELGASLTEQRRQGSYLLAKMTLRSSGRPRLPNDLVWLPTEPLWQEIVQARLESGLGDFSLSVAYADDYGVDLRFKAMIERIGLRAGGSFAQHERTIWRLQGRFKALM